MSLVTISPGASIQAAIDANPAGTIFQLSAGIYRGQHFLAKSGDQFIGAVGGGTIISGAIVLGQWTPDGPCWKANDLPVPLAAHGNPGSNPLAINREDLFVDNVVYQRVGSLSELGARKWYYNRDTRTAFISDNPNGHLIEYSVTPGLTFNNGATGVVVRHLTVEKYATDAQTGPIHGVSGWHLVDMTSRLNHGAGLSIGAGTVVQGGRYIDNGQIGINGWRSDRAKVLGAEIARNNYAGYDPDWEAGGMKISGSANVLVSGNYVHDNHGIGLWGDINDRNFSYTNNKVTHNDGNGIMYEISYGRTIIRENDVSCNKGAQIYISNSQGVEVTGNQVVVGQSNSGIAGGISMIYINRGSGPYGAYDIINNTVQGNFITHFGGGGDGIWIYYNEPAATTWPNLWDRNTYNVVDNMMPRWHFGSVNYTWQELTARTGFERHGTMVVLDKQHTMDPCRHAELDQSGSIGIHTAFLCCLAFSAIFRRRAILPAIRDGGPSLHYPY
jgi:hypothetical protein